MIERELTAGPLTLRLAFEPGGALCRVNLPAEVPENFDCATLRDLCGQLAAFPLSFSDGGPFARKVWEQMRRIPWGSALTYRELGEAIGSPLASRAIGQACGKNPLPIVVPCHRVIAETGPGGFSLGLAWKHKLLELESE
jgi:O-6-methylguanine DNA methyltransferase